MIMPSFTTLPESMLGNPDIIAKFNSSSLAGLRELGCGCSTLDDSGNCLDPDPCDTSSYNPSDCAYGGVYPNCNPAPGFTSTGQPIGSGSNVDTSGMVTAAECAQWPGYTYNPGTMECTLGSGSATAIGGSGPSSGLTASQISAIISGVSRAGQIAAAGATGATVLPNGTIVGAQGNLSTYLSSTQGKTTMMLVVVALGAALLFGRQN